MTGYTIRQAWVASENGYDAVDVRIENGRITAIAPQLDPVGTVVDGRDKLLLPGFVNAHTHSSELWQRGMIPPYPLELWLAKLYDFTPADAEQVYLSAIGTAVETLLSGGTTVVDHLTIMPGQELETIGAAVKGYREAGIRAFVGPLIQDQSLPSSIPSGGQPSAYEPYARTTQETLDLMAEAIAQFHRPDEGIYIMMAPTGPQLCSDELFAGCNELSDRHALCRHAHLLESKAQQLLAEEQYGCTAVEYLKRLDFLSPRTSLAHCVWLNESDTQLLAVTKSTVVHNPLSNLRLGSGIAPILKYRQAGVNVAIGCDGSASNDSQDLLEAIKIGSILHNVTDFEYRNWISPRQAVKMAALGGATGLGMQDEIGSLEVGKQADLVLYDLTSLSLLPRTDPIGLLVLGRPVQVVSSAWVAGRQVIADGNLTTVDVNHLRQELFARSQWEFDHDSPTLEALETRYRRVMGLGE
ncbi:MAG: amidohydrolase [Cyanobacteria bacterium J069]|nr:MAG: amidohydrolase [Cyanobacteria bacterium J069]